MKTIKEFIEIFKEDIPKKYLNNEYILLEASRRANAGRKELRMFFRELEKKKMKIGNFCEKILGVKLHKYQEEWLEQCGDNPICITHHNIFGKRFIGIDKSNGKDKSCLVELKEKKDGTLKIKRTIFIDEATKNEI